MLDHRVLSLRHPHVHATSGFEPPWPALSQLLVRTRLYPNFHTENRGVRHGGRLPPVPGRLLQSSGLFGPVSPIFSTFGQAETAVPKQTAAMTAAVRTICPKRVLLRSFC
jgi:hypothetical protein